VVLHLVWGGSWRADYCNRYHLYHHMVVIMPVEAAEKNAVVAGVKVSTTTVVE
jgi:hypothetical protein